MSERIDLPFTCEYAKSGRASCKSCKDVIAQSSLRMGIMVQSPHFDGKVPNWFHFKCFWKRAKVVKTEADIHGFDSLRWDDQEKITQQIGGGGNGTKGTDGDDGANNDFTVEYAKSAGAVCKSCEQKIKKNLVRIGKMEYDDQRAAAYGPYYRYRHLECFIKERDELEWFDGADKLPNFRKLEEEDQTMLKKKIKAKAGSKRKSDTASTSSGAAGPSDSKQPKLETSTTPEDSKEVLAMKKQSKDLWTIRDNLEKFVTKRDMAELLECNGQEVPVGESKIMDRLSDVMLFGSIKECKECNGGQLVYRSKFKFKKGRNRVFPVNRAAPSAVKEAAKQEEKLKQSPLSGLKFFIVGKNLGLQLRQIKSGIKALGGSVESKLGSNIMAVITSQEEFDSKADDKIEEAIGHDIHLVDVGFIETVKNNGNVGAAIQKHMIGSSGGDSHAKVKTLQMAKSAKSELAKSAYYKSAATSATMKIKGGAAVDPDSGKDDIAHVYEKAGDVHNVVLGIADVQSGANSYYKLQMLEHDSKQLYYIFRAWGRTGTTIGGNKLESYGSDRASALAQFTALYLDKTGNNWRDRADFVKYPNKFCPLDIDYGNDDDQPNDPDGVKPGSKTKLDKSIQKFLQMIFDIEQMKQTMKEFEIDLKKMPLGKLSKKQIQSAYQVLSDLQKIMKDGGSATHTLDASNKFYTLIPHDFGMQKPPLLDNDEIIKSKTEMLDSLLDIELAYNLLKTEKGKKGYAEKDPIDMHYESLRTDFEVVKKDEDEFKMVQDYVKNTHASTHTSYSLEVKDLFRINRHGESVRYKPFKKLPNRKLLWHGSRVSNYAGILSQGLRIAPPEAPVTGYMFGKGVYFADMVSKSANYCHTSKQNPIGSLLLCEVALGEMYERNNAEYVEKLPKGKHSCKGIGMTCPDPSSDKVLDDGSVVPLGKGMANGQIQTSLLYNEFIVYDVAQISVKYLVLLDFKWKF